LDVISGNAARPYNKAAQLPLLFFSFFRGLNRMKTKTKPKSKARPKPTAQPKSKTQKKANRAGLALISALLLCVCAAFAPGLAADPGNGQANGHEHANLGVGQGNGEGNASNPNYPPTPVPTATPGTPVVFPDSGYFRNITAQKMADNTVRIEFSVDEDIANIQDVLVDYAATKDVLNMRAFGQAEGLATGKTRCWVVTPPIAGPFYF
jgi:hypothetical protein